jgi:hypothetical protein
MIEEQFSVKNLNGLQNMCLHIKYILTRLEKCNLYWNIHMCSLQILNYYTEVLYFPKNL